MSLDFLAGCVGGAAGVIVGHPLDTVKVRLQIQTSDNIRYKGTFDCLRTTVKHEGVRGLYKGISSPLFGVAGVNALIFGVYGSLRPYVHGAPGHDALWAHFVAGSISGAVQSFIASPMELVKTRMQVNESATSVTSSPTKAPSSMEVLRSIYKNEGGLFRGVFKGWGVTLLREIPGFGTYFATYEALTTQSEYSTLNWAASYIIGALWMGGREVGTFGMMMAGGLAGVMSWLVTFPIDVVKTRLQSDVAGKYTGAIDCLKKTYKAEGHSAFSRGLVSTVIRAFPTNAATFTVVTYIMRWAESNRIDTVDDGREYLKEILNESSVLQKSFEKSFMNLPLSHYLTSSYTLDGCHSLGSSCADLIAKYGLHSRQYFNFYQCEEGIGLIREKFTKAFKNDRAHDLAEMETLISNMTTPWVKNQEFSHESESPNPLPLVDRGLGQEEKVQKIKSEEGKFQQNVDAPNSTLVTDGGTLSSLFKVLNLSSRIGSLIQTFWKNVIPTIKLCSCWDEHCVCLN